MEETDNKPRFPGVRTLGSTISEHKNMINQLNTFLSNLELKLTTHENAIVAVTTQIADIKGVIDIVRSDVSDIREHIYALES